MTLLFIFRRVMRRKFIGGSDQKFLEIGSRNFPPVVDISQRLFIADPISHTSGIDVRSDSALAAIIDHPILRHLELLYQIWDPEFKTSFPNAETLRSIAIFIYAGRKTSLDSSKTQRRCGEMADATDLKSVGP